MFTTLQSIFRCFGRYLPPKVSTCLRGGLTLVLVMVSAAVSAREYIDIVGSSTVYHFATLVAEEFGSDPKFATPRVESIGSGGGFKRFCRGVGMRFPDIVNASRSITDAELQQCREHGVKEIAEVNFGYDGIVVAHSSDGSALSLTRQDLYLGLSKYVPAMDGSTMILNHYRSWQQVNPALPDVAIEVYGPPSSSGTRAAFIDLVMGYGCQQAIVLQLLERQTAAAPSLACSQIREDGVYKAVGENDQLTVQRLQLNPSAIGIIGQGVYLRNEQQLRSIAIEGSQPTAVAIASGRYPLARPLYFYVKLDHSGLVPGLLAYAELFLSPHVSGAEGYLRRYGMVPVAAAQRSHLLSTLRRRTLVLSAVELGQR